MCRGFFSRCRMTALVCVKCTLLRLEARGRATRRPSSEGKQEGAPPRPSPVGGQFLVNRDVLGVDGDVAAGGEVLDDAAHHLARAADPRGDIVLREAFGDDAFAVLLDRVLVDEPGEPAV